MYSRIRQIFPLPLGEPYSPSVELIILSDNKNITPILTEYDLQMHTDGEMEKQVVGHQGRGKVSVFSNKVHLLTRLVLVIIH
jgi:hypothetical protein